jgi:hypothetical protein
VKFNEILDQASAEATGDYAFGAGVTVTQAKLSGVLVDAADQHLYQQVVLGVVGLSQNAAYALAVSAVTELARRDQRSARSPVSCQGCRRFGERACKRRLRKAKRRRPGTQPHLALSFLRESPPVIAIMKSAAFIANSHDPDSVRQHGKEARPF